MNKRSVEQFHKYRGENLLGYSLIDCHPEPSKTKLKKMLETPFENSYTTEKKGIKKLIHQSPWFDNNKFMGLVEISFEVPSELPNHQR